jgi:hypothetical protein
VRGGLHPARRKDRDLARLFRPRCLHARHAVAAGTSAYRAAMRKAMDGASQLVRTARFGL